MVMVSAILGCDKPVVCRVNGMRVGGGQEIGMACDFSIAQDLARFGQAGPKHGSAPIGGATDFLPYMIGCEQAMVSGLLCEPFSAHKAYRLGIVSEIVPALKVDGKFVANPTVWTDQFLDEYGRIVHGEPKTGAAAADGQALLKRGTVDLSLLDERVEALCTKLLYTFPECTTKTVEELRKPKLNAWNANKENARDWLALNMMYPQTRTVLDIGGQDTKGIQIDGSGIVANFQMNDRCAAGCGRYLGYIADEMNMGLHELGPMAMKSDRPARINSTCTVFAGAELRDRLSLGEKREDILAGLHRAIILRAISIISRSGGITNEFTFTGGVAKNEAAVRELRKVIKENYGEVTININPDSIYTGALGAAEFARRAHLGQADGSQQ